MSEDNYYVVCNHPSGIGYCALMGFASDNSEPVPTVTDRRFPTVREAFEWAESEGSEYGTSIAGDVEW